MAVDTGLAFFRDARFFLSALTVGALSAWPDATQALATTAQEFDGDQQQG